MKTIRYATIGSSQITKQFINGTYLNDAMRLSAVYSRTHERGKEFSSEWGDFPIYTDISELAKVDIDAVYVASPNKFHFEQAKEMLKNGKHVLCEKSISAHPDEVEELVRLAKENNLIFLEAIMFMHLPQRKLLDDAVKKTGNIRHACFNFCQLSSRYDALMRGEMPNIFNPTCESGALLDLGVYCVYPTVYLFGLPDEIHASSYILNTGVDGSGSVIMKYKDFSVSLNYSKLCQGLSPSQIVGDKGCITIDSISQLAGIMYNENNKEKDTLWESESKEKLMSYEAKDFAFFINNPDETRSEYERCTSTMLDVSKIMYEIRKKSGIVYPSDKT